MPVVSDALFEARLATLADRRRLLLAFVRNDGWHWADLYEDVQQERRTFPEQEGEMP